VCNGDDITRYDVSNTCFTYPFFQTPYSFKGIPYLWLATHPWLQRHPYTNEAKERVQFIMGNHTGGSQPTCGSRQSDLPIPYLGVKVNMDEDGPPTPTLHLFNTSTPTPTPNYPYPGRYYSRPMEDRATLTVEQCQVPRTQSVAHRRKDHDRNSRQSLTHGPHTIPTRKGNDAEYY